MAGSKTGALKTRDKNLASDPDFYRKLGKTGGTISRGGGFASDIVGKDGLTGKQRASVAGTKGGRVSRRKISVGKS